MGSPFEIIFKFRRTRCALSRLVAGRFSEGWRLMGLGILFLIWAGPVIAGFALNALASKCKGKNGRNACKAAAWGCWLLMLGHLCGFGPLPLIWFINLFVWLIPSAIAFIVATNSLLKEMRAQRDGEFTEAA